MSFQMVPIGFSPGCSGHLPAPGTPLILGPSSCELLGIDAYAEDDLGYAPS